MALTEIKKILEAVGPEYIPPDDTMMISSEPEDTDVCPVCHGSGWELVRLPDEQIKDMYGEGAPECYYTACQPCSACTKAARIERARSLSSPSLDVTMDDFDWTLYPGDTEKKQARVNGYLDNFQKLESASLGGLYLSSKTCGAGKTFLARCICGELISRYAVNCLFVSEADLLEASKQKPEDGSDPLAKYIGVRMLILDDLGQKSGGKQWMNDVLYRVIDRRYKGLRGIIVTSNYSLSELDGMLDNRIVDRINDMTRQVTLPEVPIRRFLSERRKASVLLNLGLEA